MSGSAREIRYNDPASWPPLGALRSDEGSSKPPTTDGLNGRTIAVSFSEGSGVRFTFSSPTILEWEVMRGEWGAETGGRGSVSSGSVEVFLPSPDLYVAHFRPQGDGRTAGVLVLDLAARSVIATWLRLQEPVTARPAVSASVFRGSIEDDTSSVGWSMTASSAIPTAELVGKRVLYDYGDGNVYEHLYLTPSLFTWVCLSGPEQGLADTESCAAYKIRDGIYLFTWREKVVPCGAAVVIDVGGSQTCGAFLGRDDSSGGVLHFTWGAHIGRIEATSYPSNVDPSRLV